MKAIVYRNYGGPELLHIEALATPIAKDHAILIKVHAAEATKADCELRSFQFAVQWFRLPLRLAMGIWKPRNPVLGGYFSGEVAALGSGVTEFSVGDKVFGACGFNFGAYGQYVSLPTTHCIVPKPRNMSHAQAAATPLGGLNALHFMRKAAIGNGDKVLINGAGGSIGTFAVQIAKRMGAEVTAVDSAIKETMLRGIGADHFIDYQQQDFSEGCSGYDVIFNMVAQYSYAKCMAALNTGGRYLMGNPRLADMLKSRFGRVQDDKQALFTFAGETCQELAVLRDMIEAGDLEAVIDRVYCPQQAADAHRRVESEQRLGIVVIDMSVFESTNAVLSEAL